MKRNVLKTIIKEIVRRTFWEMNGGQEETSWELDGTTVFITNLEAGGRRVNVEVEIEGNWDKSGFQHAFGHHSSPAQFGLEGWDIIKVTDADTETPVSLDKNILSAVENKMNEIERELPDKMPEPDIEAQRGDYDYEQQRNRDMGV